MTGAAATVRRASPFSRGAVLGIVFVGFIAFVAMLYFLSVGDTGGDDHQGSGHAAANGLNGYSGLARLLEAEGHKVTLSRLESGLESPDLLILTPPDMIEPEKLSQILRQRAYIGPTMVIVPKWFAFSIPPSLDPKVAGKVKEGWVMLSGANSPDWLAQLDKPYAIKAEVKQNKKPTWGGVWGKGALPEMVVTGAKSERGKTALVIDGDARALVLNFPNRDQFSNDENTEDVTFVIEPDLMNNYALDDPQRAALALKLVERAGYHSDVPVTFDLTLNGLGGTVNLLTLAFRPPFLAATLCLLLAMVIIGWRAFRRFGPPVASAPAMAFGKSRLVANGAGLIVRAGRMRLLADPYANLSARRLAGALGLTRPDVQAIDAALARRLPQEEPFSLRAARLRNAASPTEILRAAQSLKELEGKLST
jgi:hypothetical protein